MYKPLPFILILLAGFGLFLVHPTEALASLYRHTSLSWHSLTFKKIIIITKQQPALSPTPQIKTSITSTPTPQQTNPPHQAPAAIPTSVPPTQTPAAPTTNSTPTNDVQGFLMSEINKYRASQGLSAVQTSSQTCSFATTRAVEITSSFSHDGFNSRINNKTLPYSSWSSVTENIAQTTDYRQVVSMWINSPGHAANMRADTPYVCVAQNGSYFAYEGMRP